MSTGPDCARLRDDLVPLCTRIRCTAARPCLTSSRPDFTLHTHSPSSVSGNERGCFFVNVSSWPATLWTNTIESRAQRMSGAVRLPQQAKVIRQQPRREADIDHATRHMVGVSGDVW